MKSTLLAISLAILSNTYDYGKASYYHDMFEGRTTASGEVFRQSELTGAHKTLPFGTKVKVTNPSNEKSITVRINDRGPFVQGRIIDLTKEGARRLGMLEKGIINVKIERL